MKFTEKSAARVHLLNDKSLVYVVVDRKTIFDKLPFLARNGEKWEKIVMQADGSGVIFQYAELE